MRPHPRPPYIRKTIKWGGLAATVLLAVVWIASGWWIAQSSRTAGGYAVHIAGGRVGLTWQQPFANGPYEYQADFEDWSNGLQWMPRYKTTGPAWVVLLPLWPLVLGSLLATILAWRLDTLGRRRAALNLCPRCRYDRTGLAPGAVCPECGAAAPLTRS